MPWCTTCDRFLSPSTVPADGTCPTCGRAVDPGRARAPSPVGVGVVPDEAEVADRVDEEARPPLPWHLWLLLAALAVYLGYRAFQGIELLLGL
ncbi:MAG: hypothetical protein ABW073_03300 [Acidimicrobiia bacterium]